MRTFALVATCLVVILTVSGAWGAIATTGVSVVAGGLAQGNNASSAPSLSCIGNLVAFQSTASNLVAGDGNNASDIFVRNTATQATRLVSLNASGNQIPKGSFNPALSASGIYVAFECLGALASGDTNGKRDIYLRNLNTNKTLRVSRCGNGRAPNGASFDPAISASGRFIAYASEATDNSSDDTNGSSDIFVFDRVLVRTERVSVSSAGEAYNGNCWSPALSADGRYVAFVTEAPLSAGDTNGLADIYLRDRVLRETYRLSVGKGGVNTNGASSSPSLSADGTLVAFASQATNLSIGDTNGVSDIFVRNWRTASLVRASVGTGGVWPNGPCTEPCLSADGGYVAYTSTATNLVSGDTNSQADVFVRSLWHKTTKLASVSDSGNPADGPSGAPTLGATGQSVVYASQATNLVENDNNALADCFLSTLSGLDYRTMFSYTNIHNGGSSIQRNVSILLKFKWLVNEASAQEHFSLCDSAGNVVPKAEGVFFWLVPGRKLGFTPPADMAANTTYIVTIAKGVQKQAGGTIGWSESIVFTTGADTAHPVVSLAVSAAAAPTRSGLTQFSLNLSTAAEVQVSIKNIAGREVAVLPTKTMAAGVGTLLWSGKAKIGTTVPAGKYLATVQARTAAGAQASCLIAVIR